MEQRGYACLFVFLEAELKVALAEDWPVTEIVHNGMVFKPIGPQWSGFYDWLRSDSGRLLGVRYHPSAVTSFVLVAADGLSYSCQGQHEDLSIFFGDDRAFEARKSQDQDLLYDQVFLGPGRQVCLSFGKDGFSEDEIRDFEIAKVRWVRPAFTFGSRD